MHIGDGINQEYGLKIKPRNYAVTFFKGQSPLK